MVVDPQSKKVGAEDLLSPLHSSSV